MCIRPSSIYIYICIYQTLNHMYPSERHVYLYGWHVYLSGWHVYLSEWHVYLLEHKSVLESVISVQTPYVSVWVPYISVRMHPGANSFTTVCTLCDINSFPRVYLRTSVDLRDWLVDWCQSKQALKSLAS